MALDRSILSSAAFVLPPLDAAPPIALGNGPRPRRFAAGHNRVRDDLSVGSELPRTRIRRMTHSFAAQLPRFSYSNQHVMLIRLRWPWRTRRVNRVVRFFDWISTAG